MRDFGYCQTRVLLLELAQPADAPAPGGGVNIDLELSTIPALVLSVGVSFCFFSQIAA